MKHTLEVTLIMVCLFLGAQIIGLVIIDQYRSVQVSETGEVVSTSWQDLPSIGSFEIERPNIEPSKSVWLISFAIIVGTVLLLILIRFKHDTLWRLWFFIAVTLCLTISFGAFFGSLAAFSLAFILAYIKVFRQSFIVQNMTELFIYGGLAAIFVPILDKMSVIILLLLISAYDMYAVWKSKHMIKLAKFQTKAKIFAGMLVPYSIPKFRKPKSQHGKKVYKMVKIKTAILGGGDVGFPLIFAGVMMTSMGIWKAMVIPVFAAISLLLLLLIGRKDRFYPAMPFLTLGCLAGCGAIAIIEIITLLL